MDHKNISFKDWKEARRKRAFELKEHGWKHCEIAEALGVSKAAAASCGFAQGVCMDLEHDQRRIGNGEPHPRIVRGRGAA
jgi:hypothetical protein